MRSMPHQRYWLDAFGLGGYQIRYRKYPATGIYNGDTGRMNNSFVGCEVFHELRVVVIAHTRKISELDLVHELAHRLSPNMPHKEIDPLCERLIAARKDGSLEGLIRYHHLGLGMSS